VIWQQVPDLWAGVGWPLTDQGQGRPAPGRIRAEDIDILRLD